MRAPDVTSLQLTLTVIKQFNLHAYIFGWHISSTQSSTFLKFNVFGFMLRMLNSISLAHRPENKCVYSKISDSFEGPKSLPETVKLALNPVNGVILCAQHG